MSTMPIWLAKTREMIAMDRWFSVDDAGSEAALVARYQSAITRLVAPNNQVLRGGSQALSLQPGGPGAVSDSFLHFDEDWMNLDNLSSGGNYWPQIPTWSIIIWLRQGVLSAARKALGVSHLPSKAAANNLFRYEIANDPADPRTTVLPLVTCWVWPYQRAHIWGDVKPQLDAMWSRLHPEDQMPQPPPAEMSEPEEE
jgi:hypothetical protein